MITLNSQHIFTGYLKQLLHDFNLPKYRVYKEDEPILSSNPPKYILYIKDNKIQYYYNNKWQQLGNKNFVYNEKLSNYTKNLIINNNTYDSYTHEYLGNYLRFQRDYNNVNLMSLYNCFSNNICYNLDTTINDTNIKFDSSDQNYTIYMIPVKYFKEYTLAIEAEAQVEMFCGYYNSYLNTNFVNIHKDTYFIARDLKFNQPIIYKKLLDYIPTESERYFEQDLKLFLKVPSTLKSTIVLLEGNYSNYNDFWFDGDKTKFNKNTTNFAKLNKDFKPISQLQLLQANTGEQYAFSDRLIEYLVGNTITSQEEISDNILRAQTILKNSSNYTPVVNGLWDDDIKQYTYDKMKSKNIFDILGYIDKDAESTISDSNTTISNVDIYEEGE